VAMRAVLLVILVLALMLPAALQPKEASACVCGRMEDVEAVLHGRVGRVLDNTSYPRGGQAWTVEIEVLRVFTGKPYLTRYAVYTVNHSECDVTLIEGQEYIFLLAHDEQEFGVANCSVLLATEEDIRELGTGFPPQPNFGQPTTLPLSTWGIAAILGALVAAGFAVVLIRNWRTAR